MRMATTSISSVTSELAPCIETSAGASCGGCPVCGGFSPADDYAELVTQVQLLAETRGESFCRVAHELESLLDGGPLPFASNK